MKKKIINNLRKALKVKNNVVNKKVLNNYQVRKLKFKQIKDRRSLAAAEDRSYKEYLKSDRYLKSKAQRMLHEIRSNDIDKVNNKLSQIDYLISEGVEGTFQGYDPLLYFQKALIEYGASKKYGIENIYIDDKDSNLFENVKEAFFRLYEGQDEVSSRGYTFLKNRIGHVNFIDSLTEEDIDKIVAYDDIYNNLDYDGVENILGNVFKDQFNDILFGKRDVDLFIAHKSIEESDQDLKKRMGAKNDVALSEQEFNAKYKEHFFKLTSIISKYVYYQLDVVELRRSKRHVYINSEGGDAVDGSELADKLWSPVIVGSIDQQVKINLMYSDARDTINAILKIRDDKEKSRGDYKLIKSVLIQKSDMFINKWSNNGLLYRPLLDDIYKRYERARLGDEQYTNILFHAGSLYNAVKSATKDKNIYRQYHAVAKFHREYERKVVRVRDGKGVRVDTIFVRKNRNKDKY